MINIEEKIKNIFVRYLPSILFLFSIAVGIFRRDYVWVILFVTFIFVFELLIFVFTYKGEIELVTPDGYNQIYHPSVLHFRNGFHGWKYWMAYSPYPIGGKPYMDRWENPCVVVSNDGVKWSYPNNTIKFIDDISPEQIENRNYFSDPHIIYNSKNDELELYYRLNTGKQSERIELYKRTSKNGFNWSKRILLHSDKDSFISLKAVSPSVCYIDGIYRMWFVSDEGSKGPVYQASSIDGVNWNNFKICNLDCCDINPWHIDCQFIDNQYYLTVYDTKNVITLWTSYNGERFVYKTTLLKKSNSPGVFYNKNLYRSCLLVSDNRVRLYFSAGNKKRLSIGVAEGKDIDSIKVISASEITHDKFCVFMSDLIEKYFRVIYRLL